MSGKALIDAVTIGDKLNAWDANTKKVINDISDYYTKNKLKGWTSSVTGQTLKFSPHDVDRLLNEYVTGASDLAKQRILGVKGKDLLKVRAVPSWLKAMQASMNGDEATKLKWMKDVKGTLRHYDFFGTNVDKGLKANHMLNTFKFSQFLDPNHSASIRNMLDTMPKEMRTVLNDGTISLTDKYSKLSQLAGKSSNHMNALKNMENLILGQPANPFPGLGDFVSGSKKAIGVKDIYLTKLKPLAKALKFGGAVGAAGGLGLGLYGLTKMSSTMDKEAAYMGDDGASSGLQALKAIAGGGLTAGGLMTGTKAVRDFAEAINNPNRNVGFTYGEWDAVGAGHKTPSVNMRKILQRAIDKLPDTDPNKKIKFYDIIRNADGIVRDNLGRNYNMLYSSGMGANTPWLEFSPHETRTRELLRQGLGKTQSLRRYMTDMPTEASAGATAIEKGFLGQHVKDDKFIAYGDQDPRSYKSVIGDKIWHVAGKKGGPAIGSPFIDPAYVDTLRKYDTRDKLLARLEELASGKAEGLTAEQKPIVSEMLKRIKGGQKLITIAGSSRGDLVPERLLSTLASADKYKLGAGKVTVMPLLANYAIGDADATKNIANMLNKMDSQGRVLSAGRLPGEVYAAVQRLADVNMASTGTMALSEAAANGNINAIPRFWKNFHNNGDPAVVEKSISKYLGKPTTQMQARKWVQNTLLKGLTGKDFADKLADTELDAWNRGNIDHQLLGNRTQTANPSFMEIKNNGSAAGARKYFDNLMKNFKAPKGLNGAAETALKNQLFDTMMAPGYNMDDTMKLLSDPKRFAKATEEARKASEGFLSQIDRGQKNLINDMFKTVNKNVTKQRLLAGAKLLGPASMLGGGALMLHSALTPQNKVGDLLRASSMQPSMDMSNIFG